MIPLTTKTDFYMTFTISRRTSLACLAGASLLLTTACASTVTAASNAVVTPDSLRFNPSRYETQHLAVGGQSIAVRAFENIVYVRHPVDTTYQVMNIYVPEAYFQGKQVGGFTASTAPIFLPNQVGGYMPGKPGTAQPAAQGPRAGEATTIAAALLKGFVVAAPGARGRTTKNDQGVYTGKAPAAIVDLKAAVRYLRYNRAVMPGDTERIISNGTSAGGALSALLGASGNSPDYDLYLTAIGAASERDDIFAVSAYCPITNLEHADAAYEWLFNGVNDYRKIEMNMLDFNVARKEVAGTLTPAQIKLSDELKPSFPGYVNSLQMRSAQGQPLALDAAGNGSFKELVKGYVMASAQTALDGGKDMSKYSWLKIQASKVNDLDFDAYVRYVGRMKLPPAFDALDLSSGENNLFGTASVNSQHFTAFAAERNSAANATRVDDKPVKMMNAMRYIGSTDARTSAHWRVRHGSIDRDTSLAIPTILVTTLQNKGYTVDFAMPWDVPHSGDYDLDQLFAWMSQVSSAKP